MTTPGIKNAFSFCSKMMLIVALMLTSDFVTAQRIRFCERVEKSGVPVGVANSFIIGEKGGYFSIFVTPDKPFQGNEATIDIYKIDSDGKDVFDSSIKMQVLSGLTWFYKEVAFFKQGSFHVYVYDDRDKFLAVGKVTIIKK